MEELNTTNDDLEARSLELETMTTHGETSQLQLRGILDAVDDGVFVVGANGAIVLQSSVVTSIFGTTVDTAHLLDESGARLDGERSPISRAGRGETFSMAFRLEKPDGVFLLYEGVGQQVSVSGAPRLGVITIRQCPEEN